MHTIPVRPANCKNCAVTIGNFDGVHRGHQLLVSTTLDFCTRYSLDSVAVTFTPHPRAFFSGKHMSPLANPQTRRRLLGALGVEYLMELGFTRDIAALSPEEFYLSYLAPLKMEILVVGYDFCLGRGRSGDFASLRELGTRYGFAVHQVPPLLYAGAPISSTRIRKAIEDGDLVLARQMLGRPHTLHGKVIHGEGRGTGLGFPTANLEPAEELLPPDGVYATRVVHKGQVYAAVTNIGFKPTFDGTARTIESFLLDCDINLYHEPVRVQFLQRLRGEKRFASPAELVAQIELDVSEGRRINQEFASEFASESGSESGSSLPV